MDAHGRAHSGGPAGAACRPQRLTRGTVVMNTPKQLAIVCALALCSIDAALGSDWTFLPEPAEYAVWPEHCRVQYTYITRGANEYGQNYSQTDIAEWRDRIGEKTFIGICLLYTSPSPETPEHLVC